MKTATPKTEPSPSTQLRKAVFRGSLQALLAVVCFCTAIHAADITPAEARAIAKEAYVYGFPFVESYKTLHKQAVAPGPMFKATFNRIGHDTRVATPADTQFVTPNSDTPYSYIWMDLRAEPVVITMPRIEKGRYYVAQLVDLQTFNFGYLGTRAFGNDGGDFLIAGPGWTGEKPDGVRAVIRCETEFAYSLIRIQLFNLPDLDRVKEIQTGFQVRPLSVYLGQPIAVPPKAIVWPEPRKEMSEGTSLFPYLNFLLRFCAPHPSEKELMARFARLNIGPGLKFDAEAFTPEIRQAMNEGIAEIWQTDFPAMMKRSREGEFAASESFGTREFLKNNYAYRLFGAKLGLYGNSREEAVYPAYFENAEGKPYDGSKHRYTLRFENDKLPPCDAFWSVTMYDGKTQSLVANPLQRYLVNSTMLGSLQRDDDGSLTIYVQKDSPGADRESNWLPAPDGPFYCIMRIYLPKPEVIEKRWKEPPLLPSAASSQ